MTSKPGRCRLRRFDRDSARPRDGVRFRGGVRSEGRRIVWQSQERACGGALATQLQQCVVSGIAVHADFREDFSQFLEPFSELVEPYLHVGFGGGIPIGGSGDAGTEARRPRGATGGMARFKEDR